MKRQLAHKDLLIIKHFLGQLDINDNKVTFDLVEGVVETQDSLSHTERKEHAQAASSEEYVIAELARQAELSEQTAHRYIQNCRIYFETKYDKITLSPYNLKLLTSLDKLFTQGYTVMQVMQELREGDISILIPKPEKERRQEDRRKNLYIPFPNVSSSSVFAVDFARKHFETTEAGELSAEDEDIEDSPRGKRLLKWILWILLLLGLAALLISYQFGYLWARPNHTESRYSPESFIEVAKEGEKKREVDKIAAEETTETVDPAVPALLPAEITVDVLNGCGVRGIAGRFAEKLREEGYQVIDASNADNFSYTRSQIISRMENGEVQVILELLPQADFFTEAPTDDKPMLTVIIGDDHAS